MRPTLHNSMALSIVLDFLPERKLITMQGISRSFYDRILPSYFYSVRLGCQTINKLFSYEVEEKRVWTFDCENVAWSKKPIDNEEV